MIDHIVYQAVPWFAGLTGRSQRVAVSMATDGAANWPFSWVASSPPTSVWGAGHCMYRVALFFDHITRGEAVWEVEAMDSLASLSVSETQRCSWSTQKEQPRLCV